MKKTLSELTKIIEGKLSGDTGVIITGVGDINTARKGEISFIKDKSFIEKARNSAASAFIVPLGFGNIGKPVIEVRYPYVAFVKILNLVSLEKMSFYKGIHKTAIIGENVKFGKNVSIGACSSVECNTIIDDDTVIGSGVYVGARSSIGKNCRVYPNVSIREDTVIGNNVVLHCGAVIGSDGYGYIAEGDSYIKIPQVGRVVLEDDVEVGANSTIDRATIDSTVIGKGTKIDNQVHIAHNVKIGENSMLLAHVTIAGSTTIGKHAIFSGQAGAIDNLKIGNNVVAGSRAGILKDVPDNVIVWGMPALPIQEQKRIVLASAKLPEALKEIKELKNKVKELEDKLKKNIYLRD